MPVLRQESRTSVLKDDTFAVVYGLLARNDALGGGLFFFDGASVAVDDGISVIQPNSIIGAAPGRWIKWAL
jgi:hypothetical protein